MGSNLDYSNISINVLKKSRKILVEALNIPRAIPNDEQVIKDWRGLLHYIGAYGVSISPLITNPTEKVLEIWRSSKELAKSYNVESLLKYLKQLDRWDILDDIKEFIDEDIQFYEKNKSIFPDESKSNDIYIEENPYDLTLSNEFFDAYVLYHENDEEIGEEYVKQVLQSRKIRCITERDLLASQFKHDTIITLISERCSKLVILITKSFVESTLCRYIKTYAIALGIEKGSNKLVPLRFDSCSLPRDLQFHLPIDFTKKVKNLKEHNHLWNRVCRSINRKVPIDYNEEIAIMNYETSKNVNIPGIVNNETVESDNSRPIPETQPHGSLVSVDDNIGPIHQSQYSVSSVKVDDHKGPMPESKPRGSGSPVLVKENTENAGPILEPQPHCSTLSVEDNKNCTIYDKENTTRGVESQQDDKKKKKKGGKSYLEKIYKKCKRKKTPLKAEN